MASGSVQVNSGGVTIPVVLTIIFIVLKLVGVIGWSWLWVLAPLWISAGLAAFFFLVVALVIAIASRK